MWKFFNVVGAIFAGFGLIRLGNVGMFCIVVGLIFFAVGFILHAIKKKRDREEREIREAKLKKEQEAREAQAEEERRKIAEQRARTEEEAASGNWAFPVEEFYRACHSQKIENIAHEFTIEKARLIGRNIMTRYFIEQYAEMYLSPKQMSTYLEQGREKVLQNIRTISMNYEQKRRIANNERLKGLTGRNKRLAMIEKALSGTNVLSDKGLLDSSMAITQMNATLSAGSIKSTGDWATMGGIASGLAGPAAGLAVASQIQAENARITAENNAVAQRYANQSSSMIGSLYSRNDEARTKCDALRRIKDECKYKVVMNGDNWTSEKLMSKLDIYYSLQKESNGVLCARVEAKTSSGTADLRLPPTGKFTIDGTIKIAFLSKGKKIAEAYLPLPLMGVPLIGERIAQDIERFHEIEMVTYCDKVTELEDYSVDFTAHNLWIMEL